MTRAGFRLANHQYSMGCAVRTGDGDQYDENLEIMKGWRLWTTVAGTRRRSASRVVFSGTRSRRNASERWASRGGTDSSCRASAYAARANSHVRLMEIRGGCAR